MKKISFTMVPNSEGRFTVTNTIKYIMENIPEINVPNVDIATIPLAALTLTEDSGKHCEGGYAKGKTWIAGKCTEYELTLIFAW